MPAALLVVIVGLQLVPLPPAVWQNLPARAFYVPLDQVQGVGRIWRPISLAPDLTWNSLLSLLPPMAVMASMALLGERWHRGVLVALLVTIVASGILGLLQVAGGPESPLRLYRVTGEDVSTGLFSNRNHQAVFLAMGIPLAAWWAATASGKTRGRFRWQTAAAVAIIAFLYAAAFATESRMAFVIAPLAILTAAGLYARVGRRRLSSRSIVIGLAALLLLAAIGGAVIAVRFSDRLVAMTIGNDLRFRVLPDVLQTVKAFFPVGSGYGTFAEVFQRFESDATLRPTYLNHAHNEILNLLVEGGIVAMGLIVGFLLWFVRALWRAWRLPRRNDKAVDMARVAGVLLLMPLLSSIADYPLRAPLLACAAGICVVLMRAPSLTATAGERRDHHS